MGEELRCEYCGKTGFKTPQALAGHIGFKHAEEVASREKPGKQREELPEAPLTEEAFASLLQTFKLKADLARNIAINVSHTGGPNVFENPKLLLERLSLWSKEITPNMRKLIIEQWFAERGIDIPVNVKEKAGMTTEQLEKTEAETKAAGELRYVWDAEQLQIRMAKEGERGGTLAQAKELKKMAEEDELGGKEPAFILGEGNTWTLNPKGKIGFGEFAVFQMYQDSLKKGEPIDPVEELARREEASVRLKEAMGVKPGGQDTEMTMLDKLEKLGMLKKGEGGEGVLLAQLDALGLLKKTGGGEGGEGDLLSKLSSLGLLRKAGDEEGTGLKSELSELRKTIEDMKDERHKQEMLNLQGQIVQIQKTHEGQTREILDRMEELKKPTTGKSEMDIISDVATGMLSEAKGLRTDVKEVMREKGLPPAKTTEQREERKDKYRKALQDDQDIEEIGRRLFMGG